MWAIYPSGGHSKQEDAVRSQHEGRAKLDGAAPGALTELINHPAESWMLPVHRAVSSLAGLRTPAP